MNNNGPKIYVYMSAFMHMIYLNTGKVWSDWASWTTDPDTEWSDWASWYSWSMLNILKPKDYEDVGEKCVMYGKTEICDKVYR